MDSLLETSKLTWDLSSLLSGIDDPAAQEDLARVRAAHERFSEKWKERTDYLSEAEVLREALDDYEALQAEFQLDPDGLYGKAGYYFWLRTAQDKSDVGAQAKNQQAIEAVNQIQTLTRFFELSLGRISQENQEAFLEDQQLREYRHFLERIFSQARHKLSDVEERILSLKNATSYSKWLQLTEKALNSQKRKVPLPDGKEDEQSVAQLMSLVSDGNKDIRDQAAVALNDILHNVREIAEAELNAVLADHKTNDELRGFSRPDALRYLEDDMDPLAVDTMVAVVSRNNSISHRFYQLKAKLLGLPALAYHERNVDTGEVGTNYDWQTSCQLVNEVYSGLDPEFGEIFRSFLANGQFDVYPRVGKGTIPFCVKYTKKTPTYILLNHNNKLEDVITLAHEFGHGLNNELMRKAQNALNYDVPTSTAEVASQYLEDFFYDRLLVDADEETRLAINVTRLNDAVSSIFRQAASVRFEQRLHTAFREAGYLSVDEIGRLFQEEMAAYMGPAVEQSSGSENWWIHWGHLRDYFYNYSYASGLLIAKSMQKATRQDRGFIAKVKEFLSTGTSASPREIFARMGIDIADRTFWEAGIAEVEALLVETEELAIKLGKVPA